MNGATNLDTAYTWYRQAMSHLKAIEGWTKKSRPNFYETPAERDMGDELAGELADINLVLRPLLQNYAGLSRAAAAERLKSEGQDIRRMAVVRLFSGFEADFRPAFARQLKAAFDQLDTAQSTRRTEQGIVQALPDSIELALVLFQQLQPRFSGSDKGWLDGLRGWRNGVIHGGSKTRSSTMSKRFTST